MRRRGHSTMRDWREMHLDYLEGDRPTPPPLDLLDKGDRDRARAWVESMEAACGVDPCAKRPSTEELLARGLALPASMVRVVPKEGKIIINDGDAALTLTTDDPGRSWFTCEECRSEALTTGEDECPWCGGTFCETCSPLGEHAECRAS